LVFHHFPLSNRASAQQSSITRSPRVRDHAGCDLLLVLREPTEGAEEAEEEAEEDEDNEEDDGEVSNGPGGHRGDTGLTAVNLVLTRACPWLDRWERSCRFTVWPGTVNPPVTE